MKKMSAVSLAALVALPLPAPTRSAWGQSPVPVTANNFIRAESDRYFAAVAVTDGALGKFYHNWELPGATAGELSSARRPVSVPAIGKIVGSEHAWSGGPNYQDTALDHDPIQFESDNV